MATDVDTRVRISAFGFLAGQTQAHGEILPRTILASGFKFEGSRVPLIGPQGIFKPAILPEMPLTITTVPEIEGKKRPYEDELRYDDLLGYKYRGTDPNHRDNAGLRLALQRHAPLIYLYGILPGEYHPIWPVYIVGDNPATLTFTVQADEPRFGSIPPSNRDMQDAAARRRYVTVSTQHRLHQFGFRARVLRAYRERCAVCHLKHRELLEAAHILPDGHPKGQPVVPNGLSLCRLHHGAFDRQILGVRPDHVIELRKEVLDEEDGPMLVHGLQGFQGARIEIPRAPDLQPDRDRLEERYEMFKRAV